MATIVTDMEAVPVSNLTFYCPSWDGRWKPVTICTKSCTILPPITLEGGYDKDRTPRSRGFGLIHPSSTWPRPSLDLSSVSREKRPTWHRTRGLFTVSSSTSPWCPGMAGHSQGTSLQPPPHGSTKLHFKGTRRPCLLLPYKRAGQGSKKGEVRADEERTTDNEKPVSIPPKKINISSNLLCTLIFPLRPRLGSLSHSLWPLHKHLGARKYNTPPPRWM
jgi:hypothetical protein